MTGSLDDLLASEKNMSSDFNETQHIFVIGAGLWHAKYLNDTTLTPFRNSMKQKIGDNRTSHKLSREQGVDDGLKDQKLLQLLFLPLMIPESFLLDDDQSTHLKSVLLETASLQNTKMLESFSQMTMGRPASFKKDGVHVGDHVASTQAELLLNYLCNEITVLPSRHSESYCCVPYARLNPLQKIMLFALSYVVVNYLFWRLFRPKEIIPSGKDVAAYSGASRMIGAMPIVAAAVLSCFVADRTVLFEKGPKTTNEDMFICFSILSAIAGLITIEQTQRVLTPIKDSRFPVLEYRQILSRQQTEEWKGWMQIVILLYHYFGMSKVLWIYQLVRVLVSAYLFMTGFGHTTYFLTTNDFTLQRAAMVILRTNFFSIILSFVMGTQYDLYYFPVLSSVWFLIVWTTISRTPSSGVNLHQLFRRITLSGMLVRGLLGAVSVGEKWDSALKQIPGLGLVKIDWHEFLFRFGLDAYVVYVGMIAAVLCSRYSGNLDISHRRGSGAFIPWTRKTSKMAAPVGVFIILAYAGLCTAFHDKYSYNVWHPFASPLPVLAFVVLRNSTSKLSSSYSRLFAWFGRCSLETFVLQYHLFLGADSHGLLHLGLARILCPSLGKGKFLCDTLEFVLISTLFLWMSSALSKALPAITGSLVCPSGRTECLERWRNQTESALLPDNRCLVGTRWQDMALQTRLVLMFGALWALNILWARLD